MTPGPTTSHLAPAGGGELSWEPQRSVFPPWRGSPFLWARLHRPGGGGREAGGAGSEQSLVQNWLVHLCKFPWRHPGHPLPLGKPAPTSRHPPPLFYPRKLSLTSQIYFPSLQERRGAHFILCNKSRTHITHDALELGCMKPNHGSVGETHWRAGGGWLFYH